MSSMSWSSKKNSWYYKISSYRLKVWKNTSILAKKLNNFSKISRCTRARSALISPSKKTKKKTISTNWSNIDLTNGSKSPLKVRSLSTSKTLSRIFCSKGAKICRNSLWLSLKPLSTKPYKAGNFSKLIN